ncbi:unnamed protein product [Gadus morhua 'NCC']
MAGDLTVGILHNLVMPLLLLAASSFRYNGLSVVYFLFLLTLPLLPSPTLVTMKGKTGGFLRTVVYTSLTFLALQCFMQIPFAYVPRSDSAHWDVVLYHLGIVRFSTVDPGNIVRLLAPDLCLFVASLFVLRLLRKLLRPVPQTSLHDNGIHLSDPEEAENSDTESEGGSDVTGGSSFDSSDQSTVAVSSGPPEFVQKLLVFAAGLRLLLSAIMTTAGKVVVTVLLGLAGIMLPSLTSCVYFLVFLGLVWRWVFHRALSLLLFSSLCVMLALFSGGHLLLLYLYQLPLAQATVPPSDVYAREGEGVGMTGVIRTNASEPHSLRLHPEVCWPDLGSPLVLLLLYYTLVALLHRWVPLTGQECEESVDCEDDCESPLDPNSDLPPSFSRILYVAGDKQELLTSTDEETYLPDEPMVLLLGSSWHDLHSNELGSLLGGAGYTNCYTPPLYDEKESPSLASPDELQSGLPGAEEPGSPGTGPGTGLGSEGPAPPPTGPGGLAVVGRLLQKHSYVSGLIIMMIWSITYNSWLTFALLVWSCIIWMMRDRRRYAMLSAPFLAVYGTVLLVLGFVSALRLRRDELYPGLPLAVVGELRPQQLPPRALRAPGR